jgi:hypothetical protein
VGLDRRLEADQKQDREKVKLEGMAALPHDGLAALVGASGIATPGIPLRVRTLSRTVGGNRGPRVKGCDIADIQNLPSMLLPQHILTNSAILPCRGWAHAWEACA